MIQGLRGRVTLFRISVQQLSDEILGLGRAVREFLMVEVILAVHDLVEDLVTRFTLERQIAAHEDIEDDAKRPNVTLAVETALEHLRRHVVRRARNAVHVLVGLVLSLREAEVDELKLTLLGHHDVLRLDVPMYNALSVHMIAS